MNEDVRSTTAMLTAPPSLVVDLLLWLSTGRRAYRETMDAWRTSCPRLPVWEDAVDGGFVEIVRDAGDDGRDELTVRVTSEGRAFLERHPRR
jgi:hypothetical protein